MVAPNCKEYYPDIHARIPHGEKGDATARENRTHKILYSAVRHLLREHHFFDRDAGNGKGSTALRARDFPTGFGDRFKGDTKERPELADEKVFFASVYGILLARNLSDPSLGRGETGVRGPNDIVVPADESDGETVLIVDRFVKAVTEAVQHYNANRALFHAVFRELLDAGLRRDEDGEPVEATVYTRQLAEVAGRLIDDRVPANHPHIRRFVLDALSRALSGRGGGNSSDIDIRDIDLDAGTAVDIVVDNVLAVAGIYRSAMLEEMKLFAVAEKVAEHFSIGMIPVSRGPAGDKLYQWIREAPNRSTEIERRGVYGRVLGLAQGPAAANLTLNREFSDLWLRFCSIVSVLNREQGSYAIKTANCQQALKSARDLAVNLSLHGYGVAHFAAVETQTLLRQVLDMLQQPEILSAYGVRDYLQLVDRLSGMYLGGSVNTVRYRTMAQSGFAIMGWLAARAPQLAGNREVTEETFLDPTLVSNVERWLAVTGTPDASLEKYTDPVDIKTQPTIPAFAPMNGNGDRAAMVRNALEQAGIGGGLPSIPQL